MIRKVLEIRWAGILALVILCANTGCRPAIHNRDADLPNFQPVNASVYRGGQPSLAGLQRLNETGVRTIINVRGDHAQAEYAKQLGFAYEHRPMSAWKPCDEDVIWFLTIASDPARAPVFLHCQHGSDRTGYLIAMYRIVVEGWDRERAIAEMKCDGNGFHPFCGHLVRYVRDADITELKKKLASSAPVQASE